MFTTILAACDAGTKGRDAVALAATLARAEHARLVLVAAYDPPIVPTPAEFGASSLRRQTETAMRRLADALAPDADVRVVPSHSATRAVRHVAEAERADLVVVGSSRSTRRDRLDPDHALGVLHGAPHAVAVVPDGAGAGGRPARLTVGFDGSRESRSALAVASDLARSLGASLNICAAVDDHVPGPSAAWAAAGGGLNATAMLTGRRERADVLLNRATAAVAGVPVTTDVLVGDPAEVLGGTGADIVVVGSRGRGPLGRVAFGSTSDSLVRRAHVPVLVVPRAAATDPTPEEATRCTAT